MGLGAWTPNPQVWAQILLHHHLAVGSVTPSFHTCKTRILCLPSKVATRLAVPSA